MWLELYKIAWDKIMSCFLIFPNQLFENIDHLRGYDHVFLVEESIYYFDEKYKKIRPSKIKLSFLRACMKTYCDMLSTHHIKNVSYVDYEHTITYDFLKGYHNISCYHPNDHDLMRKMKTLNITLLIHDSPNFLLSIRDLVGFHTEHTEHGARRKIRHSSFYSFARRKLHILEDVESTDKENREKLPSGLRIPLTSAVNVIRSNKHRDEAASYVERKFPKHIGSTEALHSYAVSSADAYKVFGHFLKAKFANFGRYQDAIQKDEDTLFHSRISAYLNVGLLDVHKIVAMTLRYSIKNKTALNNVEGFIRQIIGWREYMRYLYLFHYSEMISSNLPKNSKKLPATWYTAETGLFPVDHEISKAMRTGYAHHIVRLMIFLNSMILHETRPYDIYKWFMQVVSIDAYSWVMIPNIYAMGFFYGNATYKPYISSSNYILRMSDYKRDGIWEVRWDELFRRFLSRKPKVYTNMYRKSIPTR